MAESPSLEAVAQTFSDIGQTMMRAGSEPGSLLPIIARQAAITVPGVAHAGITQLRNGHLQTVAPTSETAATLDTLQHELRSGPCVDAVFKVGTFRTGDLAADPRWPDFGPRAVAATGVRSVLALHLFLEASDVVAALNLYSEELDAFPDTAVHLATLLATQAAMAMVAATARQQSRHLAIALESSRDIGAAIGVLMHMHKVTREQAFDLLRVASQYTHRELGDIALDVVDTGTLELPPHH